MSTLLCLFLKRQNWWNPGMPCLFRKQNRHAIRLVLVFNCLAANALLISGALAQSLETGVFIKQLEVDPAGKFAAVFGSPVNDDFNWHSSMHLPFSQIAVLDLKTRKLVASKPISGDLRGVFVDGHHVFWLARNVNVIYKLEIDGQAEIQAKPLTCPATNILDLTDEAFGVVALDDEVSKLVVYDKSSMEELKSNPLNMKYIGRGVRENQNPVIHLGDNRIFMGNSVFERNGKFCCYTSAMDLPKLTEDSSPVMSRINGLLGSDLRWRRYASRVAVFKVGQSSTPLFALHSQHSDLSSTLPIVGSASRSLEHEDRNRVVFDIELRELVYGKLVKQLEFVQEFPHEVQRIKNLDFRLAGKSVVLAFDNWLHVEQLSDQLIRKTKINSPLVFKYPTVPVGDIEKNYQLQLTARGGEPPYSFGIQNPSAGIEINNNTLEIDFPRLWKSKFESPGKALIAGALYWENSRYRQSHRPQTEIEVPAGRFIVTVPLQLAVNDSAGQSDWINVYVPCFASVEELMQEQQLIRDYNLTRVSGSHEKKSEKAFEERLNQIDDRLERIEKMLRQHLDDDDRKS